MTKNISIRAPLCSAAMDTVTETEMATGMALNGGIGFIHGDQDIEDQVEMIRQVKCKWNAHVVINSFIDTKTVDTYCHVCIVILLG